LLLLEIKSVIFARRNLLKDFSLRMKYLSVLLTIVGFAGAISATAIGGTGGFVTLALDGPKSTTTYYSICGTYTYFKVNMPYPCRDLNIEGISTCFY